MAPTRAAGVAVAAVLLAACGPVVELRPPDLQATPRDVPEQSQVLDAGGAALGVLRHRHRQRVPLDGMPPYLVDAVVAAEDRRFFTHGGLDARALVRAALTNVAAGEIKQGGSTITQQLAGLLYTDGSGDSAESKVREMLLARQLEREHGKAWILEEYLNTIYLGAGAYGVEAAAQTYWRRPVGELRLHEVALLAGLIRAPEALNPMRNPQAARQRRDRVLDAMVTEGVVAAAEAAAATAEPVEVAARPPVPPAREPHWVDFVVRTLLDAPSFGSTEQQRAARLFGGGLRIHTTLRPDLQAAAEAATRRFLPDDPDQPEVALVAVVPGTGEVVAAVGGRDHTRLQFDLATQARRQTGSTFKTFVLAAAVAAGYGPDHRVSGAQATLDTPRGPWTVRNYDRVSRGMITLEEATRASVNAAFARLGLQIGIDRVVATAHALGITSPLNEDPAVALGGLEVGVSPLEMAAAYATLANGGSRVPVSPVARIENAEGQVVWRPDRTPRKALDPSAAYVVTRMLQTVVEEGTGRAADLPDRPVAGKTGTVDDHTDAWFVGYTPGLAAAVWVGHPHGRVPLTGVAGIRRVTGGTLPARIWRAFMEEALADRPPQPFTLAAEHFRAVEIDPATGLLAAPWCPGEQRLLPRAIVPRETCPRPAPSPSAPPAPSPTISPGTSPTPPPEQSPGTSPAPSPGTSPAPSPGTSPTPPPEQSPGTSPTPAPGAPPDASPAPSPDPTPAATSAPSPSASPGTGG